MNYRIGDRLVVSYASLSGCPNGSLATIVEHDIYGFWLKFNHLKSARTGGYADSELATWFKRVPKKVLILLED